MTALQKMTSTFAALCMVALIVFCWRDADAVAPILAFAVLFALSIIVTVFNPSELSLNMLKGELSMKTATPEQVTVALKTDAEMEKIERKDGEGADKKSSPLAEEAKHKTATERTDADYLTLATDAWRAENFDDALRFAYAGLERPASDPRITAGLYSRLGAIENDLGLAEYAERHCRRALQISPDLSAAHNNLGNSLRRTNRPEAAEAAYRESLRLDPGDSVVYNNLGILLRVTDRPEAAEAAYREALRLDPGYAYAHINLGNLLSATDRPEKAEAAYREAIRLDPGLAAAHNNLGNLLSKTDRPEEAEAAFREALRLDPEHAKARGNLEVLLQRKNENKDESAP